MGTADFLSEPERERIREAVRAAEAGTSGEIVALVIPESFHYPVARIAGAAAVALPAAVALTPVAGRYLWIGDQSMWLFIALFTLLFVLLNPLVDRFPAFKRFFISRQEMEAEVEEAAITLFYREKLHDTRERNGILLLVSVFERNIRILADSGINDRVQPSAWKGIVDDIVSGIRAGSAARSICNGIDRIGRILSSHFPPQPDDRDELTNLIVKE
ncbi:MAG: TPM domain-containing protein [Desulfobacterales bacterium]